MKDDSARTSVYGVDVHADLVQAGKPLVGRNIVPDARVNGRFCLVTFQPIFDLFDATFRNEGNAQNEPLYGIDVKKLAHRLSMRLNGESLEDKSFCTHAMIICECRLRG
jgi:hypothetical protein